MRTLLLIVVAIVALGAAGCADENDDNGPEVITLGDLIGSVDSTGSRAYVDEAEVFRDDPIYERSVIETDDRGFIVFNTQDVAKCDSRKDSELQIRPTQDVAIEWRPPTGQSWCNKVPSTNPQKYGIQGKMVIEMADPIFGVVYEDDGVTFKLVDGEATVFFVELDEPPLLLRSGEEVFVTEEGFEHRELRLSPEDESIIDSLRDGAGSGDLPDLVMDLDFFEAPDEQTCILTFSVTNIGRAPAGPFLVAVELSSGTGETEVPGLEVNDNTEVVVFVGGGCFFEPDPAVIAMVDAVRSVDESNEGNNDALSFAFDDQVDLPDLVIEIDSREQPDDQTCNLKFVVTNLGPAPAGPFRVEVEISSGTGEGELPGLEADGVTDVEVTVDGACFVDGTLNGIAIVDSRDSVEESNEANNEVLIFDQR